MKLCNFPIIPENEMKKGKLLIPNGDRCTITISDIDEDIVLPSAKKVREKERDLTQSYDKSPYTDRKIQKAT